jgi:hypothetical protein
MCEKHTPKKDGRFLVDGITFEISVGKLSSEGISYEISSKIPVEKLPKKGDSEKYFKDVKKLMLSKNKKPADIKMENITHSTNINEIKERNYVKCSYLYKEDELYTDDEVMKMVKEADVNQIDLSKITGVNTLAGKAVIYSINKSMYETASETINDLLKSNSETITNY